MMIRRNHIFLTCFLGAGAFALTLLMLVYLSIPQMPGVGLTSLDVAALMIGDTGKALFEIITLTFICLLGATMVSRIIVTQEHQQLVLRKQLFTSYAHLQESQDELRTLKDTLKQVKKLAEEMGNRLRRLEAGAPQEAVLSTDEYEVPGGKQENTHLKLTLESVTDELAQASDALREMMPSAQSLEHTLSPLHSRANAASEALVILDRLVQRLNRLVLNATLEAARFGDQGESIIRLMDEFKTLARDTAEQASSIGEQMWHVKETLSTTTSPLSALLNDAEATLRHIGEATNLLDTQWESLVAKPDLSDDPVVARAVAEAAKQAAVLEEKIVRLFTPHRKAA